MKQIKRVVGGCRGGRGDVAMSPWQWHDPGTGPTQMAFSSWAWQTVLEDWVAHAEHEAQVRLVDGSCAWGGWVHGVWF